MRVWLLWGLCVLYVVNMRSPGPAARILVRADTDSVRVAVVRGDSLVGTRVDGETVEMIFGNVHVMQDSTIVTSDRARRLVDRRTIHFTGRVQMTDRGDSLAADLLVYDETQKVGQAQGNVRLTDGDVVAYAPEGEHYVDEKWSIFPAGVRIEDSTTTLTGGSGQYWSREKRAELTSDVQMSREDVRMWADSLTHLRDSQQSTARSRVMVEQVDGADTTRISGQWVHHDQEAKRSVVTGSPVMVQLRQDSLEVDTLVVASDYMRLQDEEDFRQLLAGGRVQIWNKEFSASSDSLAFEEVGSTQTVLLRGKPILWVEDSQITGDTIRVTLTDGELDSLFAFGEAFVAQLDSATGRINQAKGQSLLGTSEEDSIRTFTLGPNAEALYFAHQEDPGPDGVLEASGDQIVLRMVNRKLRRILFSSGIEGTQYPEASMPAELSLDGLQWLVQMRPDKEGLMSEFHWSDAARVP